MSPESRDQKMAFVCDWQYETPIPLDSSTAMPKALDLDKHVQPPSSICYVALGDFYSAEMAASRKAYSSCLQHSSAFWPSSIASWLQSDGKLPDSQWVHAACTGYTTGMKV